MMSESFVPSDGRILWTGSCRSLTIQNGSQELGLIMQRIYSNLKAIELQFIPQVIFHVKHGFMRECSVLSDLLYNSLM